MVSVNYTNNNNNNCNNIIYVYFDQCSYKIKLKVKQKDGLN